MADEPKVIVRPIGKVKQKQGFLENPLVQDLVEGLLIPLIKSGIQMIVERLLFGDQGSPAQPSGRVSYRPFYDQPRKYGTNPTVDRFQQYQAVRSQFPQLEDLVFRTEQEAVLVVNELYSRIETFTYVTMSDLYEIVGLNVPDYTYTQFGWNQGQLSRYELRDLPNGVRLIMPRPFPIPR